MRAFLAVLIGRLVRYGIRLVRPGGGSSVPGRVAAFIYPDLLQRALRTLPEGVVVVSGSAGKSSTTKMLVDLVKAHGKRVFTNTSTSNIRQGFYSSILQHGNLLGRLNADIAILEWDEGHGAALSNQINPRLCVLTNVLSDQLDRFVDPEIVIEKLKTISNNSSYTIANGNDKNLTQFLQSKDNVQYFGLAQPLAESPNAPSYALNFDPDPKPELSAEVMSSDVSLDVKLLGQQASYKRQGHGLPMALNQVAALLAATKLLPNFSTTKAVEVFESAEPVFARDEKVLVRGQAIRLLLVQNPTSFQLNLDFLEGQPESLMMLAGTDIHDPSWLWTVDFSKLERVDVVGGFNAHELALRLMVQGVVVGQIIRDVPSAVDVFLAQTTQNKTVLFSADGMRQMRRYLRLAK